MTLGSSRGGLHAILCHLASSSAEHAELVVKAALLLIGGELAITA